ncbi:hypothetical protein PUN28_004794 [Cardiocondyla obscurior]|uniref:Uncharacterized protein n=1 Tax=Cardiocondyla obscurior TaxID=286306 RepID=A0AAW2GFB8_9HYME
MSAKFVSVGRRNKMTTRQKRRSNLLAMPESSARTLLTSPRTKSTAIADHYVRAEISSSRENCVKEQKFGASETPLSCHGVLGYDLTSSTSAEKRGYKLRKKKKKKKN